MRRTEAVVLVAVALALIVSGLVWLLGAYGLLGSGVLLLAVALFGVDVREERDAEPVAVPAWAQRSR
jgi:hypothetical protein